MGRAAGRRRAVLARRAGADALSLVDELLALARAATPQEACGLIVRRPDGLVVVPLANRAQQPAKAFLIEPLDVLAVSRTGPLQAVWHSHPHGAATPSAADHAAARAWPDLQHLIVGLQPAAVTAWLVDGGQLVPDPAGPPGGLPGGVC